MKFKLSPLNAIINQKEQINPSDTSHVLSRKSSALVSRSAGVVELYAFFFPYSPAPEKSNYRYFCFYP